MDYSGWTQEELEARLEELEDAADEYEALELWRDLLYLESEGFITIVDGRIYPEGDAVELPMPKVK